MKNLSRRNVVIQLKKKQNKKKKKKTNKKQNKKKKNEFQRTEHFFTKFPRFWVTFFSYQANIVHCSTLLYMYILLLVLSSWKRHKSVSIWAEEQ